MKMRQLHIRGILLIGVLFAVCLPAKAGEWRIHLGPSFMSGFMDVADFYEDAMPHEVDFDWQVPVGLGFSAAYEFSHGSRLAAGVGPAGVIYVYEVNGDDDWSYYDVPLSISYGFSFVPRGNVSPYARAGVRYHVAGGDFVDSSTPGLFGAFGMEFMRSEVIGWGGELAYDASSIKMEGGKEIEPGAFVASVFVSL